jgi:hypothetical protein
MFDKTVEQAPSLNIVAWSDSTTAKLKDGTPVAL